MPALLPSELPVRARTRHHWIVLLRRPHRVALVVLAVAVVAAVLVPNPVAWLVGAALLLVGFMRRRAWKAEQVILTGKRIIRVQGIPETTRSETSMRVDRIAGIRLVETVPGKILGYGSIELEAPGEHQVVRRLVRIAEPHDFYLALRRVVFGENNRIDPDDEPGNYITEPLPQLAQRDRRRDHRRRLGPGHG